METQFGTAAGSVWFNEPWFRALVLLLMFNLVALTIVAVALVRLRATPEELTRGICFTLLFGSLLIVGNFAMAGFSDQALGTILSLLGTFGGYVAGRWMGAAAARGAAGVEAGAPPLQPPRPPRTRVDDGKEEGLPS